ncbi:kinase-like protein, partial [Fistulina hepatica ATCC 64428]
GCVYQAQDVWTGKDVAVKTQRIVHPGEFLLIEAVHKATSGSPHFPQLEYIALVQDHVVTVTELLGSDMYEVLAHGGPVTDEMVGRIAIQMIDALEHLHSRGLLHMDLKPENIMGTLDDPMQFKLIDFGSSTPFITENGKHVPLSDGVRIPYTDLYQSLHAALRLHPSRRDDMESLAYVLFSMSYGRLPWEQDSPQIMFSKKYAAPWDPTLRREIPPAVMQYLVMVRQLRFEERPDYEGYRWMFRSML